MNLTVERREQRDKTPTFATRGGGSVMMTPALDEDYWSYRVRLSERQALLAFPKFGTVGIGFAVEEDWNTNLPYTSDAETIAAHIMHNKGDETIREADVVAGIKLLQTAIRAGRQVTN